MADIKSRTGSAYGEEAILEFVDRLYHSESNGMIAALEAISTRNLPAIQVGAGDGAILALLLRLIGARKVVEVGTLTGYSALWMLRGMPDQGRIWTFESDPVAAEEARRVFHREHVNHRVFVVEGPAGQMLPTIESIGPFDAVFIDADKEGYPTYAEWAFAHVRSGGLVLADNAYLFGHLADREPSGRASAEDIAALRRFHRLLAEKCPGATVVPTPDGLAFGVVP